ncbi:MAG: hypothetical protein U5R46_12005 [Gammaproteobacteria bacterium]|nr:hypothetical protein [Gammaproteobacteria bacterium]
MNLNVVFVVVVAAFAVYIWNDLQEDNSGQVARSSPETTAMQQAEEAQRLLEEARRERERLEQVKMDMEFERMNAELDRNIAEQERRDQLEREREKARQQSQLQEWKEDFNDRADRRDAWEDYNASKDAVTGVARDEHWNISEPESSYDYDDNDALIELPKQQLRRRYGDSATLEQNELQ